MKSYRDSAAYQRSNRMRVDENRPVWPLTAADLPVSHWTALRHADQRQPSNIFEPRKAA